MKDAQSAAAMRSERLLLGCGLDLTRADDSDDLRRSHCPMKPSVYRLLQVCPWKHGGVAAAA